LSVLPRQEHGRARLPEKETLRATKPSSTATLPADLRRSPRSATGSRYR
jgi:hypothetical protein